MSKRGVALRIFFRGRTLLAFFLFIHFCYSTNFAFALNKKDSLLNFFKTDKEDTTKVKHLILLGEQYYMQSQTDKGMICDDSAIALAQRLNYGKGYANANADLGTAYVNQEKYMQAWNLF